jgi:hypothetical protein
MSRSGDRHQPKPNKRAALRSAAFEWMRSVLQKEISDDALRREIVTCPTSTACYAACMKDAYPIATGQWSFWRADAVWPLRNPTRIA